MKKLFILQYSQELDLFQLQEVDNPQELPSFQIPVINAPHQSIIKLSSHLIDTDKVECSFPNAQMFANPHNDLSKGPKLGLLYNWFALSHPNFAPAGWHVPSTVEINSLVYEIGNEATAGGILKETGTEYWSEPNRYATNAVGFNARGGGVRYQSGAFASLYEQTYIGTASQYGDNAVHIWIIYYNDQVIRPMRVYNKVGLSTRLLKNDGQDPGIITDIDGNIYPTVKIGNRVWLAANWRCTSFNDGSPIPNIEDGTEWAAMESPAYCAYNNDLSLV